MQAYWARPFLHHTLTIGYVPPEGHAVTVQDLLPALLERAGQVAAYANSIGLTVLYEPQGFYVNGLDGFPAFYDAMKARGYDVGVCGDTGNSLYVGCDPAAFFARYASDVRHVHLKDLHLEDEVLHRGNATASRRWDMIADGRFVTETRLGEGDVLIITADHGCDPTDDSTDHTREYVPYLLLDAEGEPENLGTLRGFTHVADTVCRLLGVE